MNVTNAAMHWKNEHDKVAEKYIKTLEERDRLAQEVEGLRRELRESVLFLFFYVLEQNPFFFSSK